MLHVPLPPAVHGGGVGTVGAPGGGGAVRALGAGGPHADGRLPGGGGAQADRRLPGAGGRRGGGARGHGGGPWRDRGALLIELVRPRLETPDIVH